MIPSWDEPAFKASFALRVTVPSGEMAVSNMPIKSSTPLAGRARERALRRYAEDVDLSAVLRAGRLRTRHGECGRHRTGRRHAPRQPAASRVRPRILASGPARVQRLFRRALSAAQARQHRRPGPQPVLRRDGKLGRDLHLRVRAAARPGDFDPARQAGNLRHRRPRDGAPVVRRPGHHALVGRPLAQRRLRLLDGVAHDGAPAPGMEHPPRHRERARRRHAARCAGHHPPGGAARRHRRAGQPGLRRDHLPEGRSGDPHARGLCRRGRLAPRRARATCANTPTAIPHRATCGARSNAPPPSPSRRSPATSRCSRACR